MSVSTSSRKRKSGFARVPNWLIDALALVDLTGRELKVVLALVFRRILGWKERRKTCRVRVSRLELAEATALAETDVRRALVSLEERGIIRRLSSAKKGSPAEYLFEPRPGRWNPAITGFGPGESGCKTHPESHPESGCKTHPEQIFRVQNRPNRGAIPHPEHESNTPEKAHNHAGSSGGQKRLKKLKKGTSLTIRSAAGSPGRGYQQTEEEFEADLAALAAKNPGLFTPAYLEIQREYRARDLAALARNGRRP